MARPWIRVAFAIAVGCALVAGADPQAGSDIRVTPGAVDDVANGNCSLVEAIVAANTDQARDGCPAGSGADTLHAAGRYLLTGVPVGATSRTGLPTVTSEITIVDAKVSRAPDAAGFRILEVAAGGALTLVNGRVSGGSAIDCPDGGAAICAGGILNLGALRLVNTQVLGNRAAGSGPIVGGAGMVNVGSASLTDSIVSDNTATGDSAAVGGGITNNTGATLRLVNSAVRDNTANGVTVAVGGGLANFGTAELTTSRVLHNDAVAGAGTAAGGGIYQENASTTLRLTRVSGNLPDDCRPAIGTACD